MLKTTQKKTQKKKTMKNDILLFAVMFAVSWIGYNVAKDRLQPAATAVTESETVTSDAIKPVEETPSANPKPTTQPSSTPAQDPESTDIEPDNPEAAKPKEVVSNLNMADPESAEPQTTEQKIEQVLIDQTVAWNRGDLDGFMDAYWNNENLTFSGGGETTLGWDATYANYKERYPAGEMGKIKFKDLKTEMVGKESAIVTGRFDHQLADEKVKGNFSLVVKMFDGQWKIIHDHTSVAN